MKGEFRLRTCNVSAPNYAGTKAYITVSCSSLSYNSEVFNIDYVTKVTQDYGIV
jgi:hypothetical protein